MWSVELHLERLIRQFTAINKHVFVSVSSFDLTVCQSFRLIVIEKFSDF